MSTDYDDFYVVAYDVTSDKRRNKVVKILEDFGDRVQYSVYEILADSKGLDRIRSRLQNTIDQETDGVRIYHLCRSCKNKTEIIGRGLSYHVEDTIVL